jgi:RNase P/RNase MRP subunit p30
VRSLSPAIFASVPDTERARALIKRTHYIHMPLWQPDVGLARLFKEHDAVMVIGVCDFLPLPPHEMAKRLARTVHMARMVRHFGGVVRLASMAKDERGLRNPLELMCLGARLGLSPAVVMEGLNARLEASSL